MKAEAVSLAANQFASINTLALLTLNLEVHFILHSVLEHNRLASL